MMTASRLLYAYGLLSLVALPIVHAKPVDEQLLAAQMAYQRASVQLSIAAERLKHAQQVKRQADSRLAEAQQAAKVSDAELADAETRWREADMTMQQFSQQLDAVWERRETAP